MIDVADVDLPASDTGPLNLRVTAQAKVGVALGKHFGIDRTVDIMTSGTALAHRGMLKDEWTGLLPVTFGAGFIQASQVETAGRFKHVTSMRVMALDTVHFLFQHWMMLRQVELCFDRPMTLETGSRVFTGIHNKLSPASAAGDMKASWTVTGLATGLPGSLDALQMNAGVRTGGKDSGNVGMALGAGSVAYKTGARHFRSSR